MNALMYPFLFLSIYFQVFMLSNFFSGRRAMHLEDKVSDKSYAKYSNLHDDGYVLDNDIYTPEVSFLIPAWNESKTLGGTIESIFNLIYPKDKITIFIINDGSSDNTLEIAKSFENYDINKKEYYFNNSNNRNGDKSVNESEKDTNSIKVIVLDKKNGGKYTALNLALTYVTSELIICLDADSYVDEKALIIAAQYFKDESVKGLASCMQIKDTPTWVHKIQRIEYLLSIFWKKSYSNIDAIQVVPGPFSIFRKSVFDELGNYRPAHNAEDLEMTMRMHKHGYRIVNAHRAYVYTVGPDTLKGLIKQRVRWMRGFLDNAWDYREMFFKKKYGHFGLFTLPIAVSLIFYVVFAITYAVYKSLIALYNKYEELSILGFKLPFSEWNGIDWFFVNTDIMLFLEMFVLTVLAFVIFTSRQIAKDERPLLKHLLMYYFLYPLIAPIFIFKAVFGSIFKTKSTWGLQDNKSI